MINTDYLSLVTALNARGVESAALRDQMLRAELRVSAKRATKLLAGSVAPTLAEFVVMLRFVDRVLPAWNSLPVVALDLSPKLSVLAQLASVRHLYDGKQVLLSITRARESLLRSMPPLQLTQSVSADPAQPLLSGAPLASAALSLWNAAQSRGSDPHAALSAFCVKVSTAIVQRVYGALDYPEAEPVQQADWIKAVHAYCRAVPNALATRYDTIARFAPTPVVPLTATEILERFAFTEGVAA